MAGPLPGHDGERVACNGEFSEPFQSFRKKLLRDAKLCFQFSEILLFISSSRLDQRGVSADRHQTWKRDAMDGAASDDERRGHGRPKRVGLAPKWQVPSLRA
jgi:hypothetical protein